MYIHANIVTRYALASNNRGLSEGNHATLQKLFWMGASHTKVSSVAIRFAVRELATKMGLPMNRVAIENKDGFDVYYAYNDPKWSSSLKNKYYDFDVLGGMLAEKAKKADKGETQEKGETNRRTSRLSMNEAISLDPWMGDISFNCASPGVTDAATAKTAAAFANKIKPPTPYTADLHATRYQFPATLDLDGVHNEEYIKPTIEMLTKLSKVGGNHSRYLYDFSPDSIVLRYTDDPTHKMSYCFQHDDSYNLDSPDLLHLVKCGDIDPNTLYIGGTFANTTTGEELAQIEGVNVFEGVQECVQSFLGERVANYKRA